MIKFLIIGLIFSSTSLAQAKFLRYPALSPDAQEISFSYGGDLYKSPAQGGTAVRLTQHPAYEGVSLWSPDGKYIVFESDRKGNIDLFRMDLQTGDILQLTFFEKDEHLCSFTPDGQSILLSALYEQPFPHHPTLYRLSIQGGTPIRILDDFSTYGCFSPKEEVLFYTRGQVDWWRLGYRGSLNEDIYRSPETGTYEKWTRHLGQDRFPLPLSGTHFFYLSDEQPALIGTKSTVFNLWEWNQKERKQITFHKDSVRFPRMNAQQTHLVYASGFDLFLYTLKTQQSKRIHILPFFGELEAKETEEILTRIEAFDVSPEGKNFLLVSQGDLFSFYRNKEGWVSSPKYLAPSVAQEKNPILFNQSQSAYFVSDRTGQNQIYQLQSLEEDLPLGLSSQHKVEFVSRSNEEEFLASLSPDRQKIVFIRSNGEIVLRYLKTQQERILAQNPFPPDRYCWSPDSQWICFESKDENFNSEIFLVSIHGRSLFNLSMHPDYDGEPSWSPDGTRISFVSKRYGHSNDVYVIVLDKAFYESSLEEEHLEEVRQAYQYAKQQKKKNLSRTLSPNPTEKTELKKRLLRPNDPRMEDPTVDEGSWILHEWEPSTPKKREESPSLETTEHAWVQIDFEELTSRIQRVTYGLGDEHFPVWSPNAEGLFFTANLDRPDEEGREVKRDLFYVSLNTLQSRQMTFGGKNPEQYCIRGNTLYFLASNFLYEMAFSVENADPIKYNTPQRIPFQFRQKYVLKDWRQYLFAEVWKLVKQNFYDAQFHQKLWVALGWKYAYGVQFVQHPKDFLDLIHLMFGELNVSHLSYEQPLKNTVKTGILGISYEPVSNGFQILEVTPGGPCDLEKARVVLGEILIAIDQIPLSTNINIHRLLENKAHQEVELTLSNEGEIRHLKVRPISWEQFTSLDYREYCRKNQEQVERLSRRKLGYIHLPKMTPEAFYEFERNLYLLTQEQKDGFVLDIRENVGGWYADYFLMALHFPEHANIRFQNGQMGYPQQRRPFYSWSKKIVVLCNEYTFSNAEIFAHAIQSLQRGPLVGTVTPGYVASARRFPLLNGASLQVPYLGWYRISSQLNMENGGAVPDQLASRPPGESFQGEDTPLDQAVKVLVESLSK